MTNMKTVLFTDELRASSNNPGGLTKRWVFNGDNCAMGIQRQQSGSVVMILGGVIKEELIGSFRVSEELKLPVDTYCLFLKNSVEP